MVFYTKKHLFILGAGSSVDYGLPTWKKLSDLVKIKTENDNNNLYKYKVEILNWLDRIGENKKYKTIDECVMAESVSRDYHNNGHEIENEIYKIIMDIFEESYKDNDTGWIRKLNENIKNKENLDLEDKISFINYNYDDVLDKNFLNFEYLPAKYKLFNYKNRLKILSDVKANCFYPHGYFSSKCDSSYMDKEKDTIKSGNEEFIDVVSCYESKKHSVSTYNLAQTTSLYILGLGGGLETNLKNIGFGNKISDIHITIRDKSLENQIISFLSEKFKLDQTEIKVYDDCYDLVDNCFN